MLFGLNKSKNAFYSASLDSTANGESSIILCYPVRIHRILRFKGHQGMISVSGESKYSMYTERIS